MESTTILKPENKGQGLIAICIEDCEMALNNEWDRSDEGFKETLKNLKALKRIFSKQSAELEALKANAKDLKSTARQLGKAIEKGDPVDIADLWVFHVKPMIKKIK